MEGQHILELGSGAGLVGLIAGKLSSSNRVTLTDGNDQSLELLKTNIAVNFCLDDVDNDDADGNADDTRTKKERKMAVARLAWGNESDAKAIIARHSKADFIIGSDVLYPTISQIQVAALLRSAGNLLVQHAEDATSSFSCCSGRLILSFIARDGKRTLRHLLLAAREEGFVLEQVICQQELKNDYDDDQKEDSDDHRVAMGAQILILRPQAAAGNHKRLDQKQQEEEEEKLLPGIWARDPTPEPPEEWICPFEEDEIHITTDGSKEKK